jgi:hypothetical protein
MNKPSSFYREEPAYSATLQQSNTDDLYVRLLEIGLLFKLKYFKLGQNFESYST